MAGIVKSVERVTFTDFSGNSGTLETDLTKGQALGQCVAFKTWKANSNPAQNQWRDNTQLVELFDNSGTAAVRVSAADRTATPGYRTDVIVTVVEFDSSVNVQSHPVSIAAAASSDTITITDVGAQSSAFILCDYYANIQNDEAEHAYCRWHFDGASTTSVVVERRATTGSIDGVLYVVDCDAGEFTVDHIEHTPPTSYFSDDITISATVLASSFLLSCYDSGEGNDDMRDSNAVAKLTTTTNVNVARSQGTSGSTTDVTFNLQVVEAQNAEFTVERGEEVITSASQTEAITSVDLAFAMVNPLDHHNHLTATGRNNSTSPGEIDNMAVAVTFNSATELAFTHRNYRRQQNLPWEVIEWAEATAGTGGDIAATEAAQTGALAGGVVVAGDLAGTEAAQTGALAGTVGSTAAGDIAAGQAAQGARLNGGRAITNQYAQMHVRANEQGGETLTNYTGDNSIATPAFLPADAWDNYDPANFRASVRIGDVNFNHTTGTSLALMRAKYPGHPNRTFGSKENPGDSCFTAVMFSLEVTPGVSFGVYEVGSDPSVSTIGKVTGSINSSVGDGGLGSLAQPYDSGAPIAPLPVVTDGARRIYGFTIHTERDTEYEGADGNAVKVWWSRHEFDTAGNVVTSDHGQTFLDTDPRITDGTPVDDLVDLAVTAITGTIESECYGWFHCNYPHGFRGDFVSSQALHDQAEAAFTAWGNGTKTIPAEWLAIADRRNPGDLTASQAADAAAFAGGVVVAGDLAADQAEQTGAFVGGDVTGGDLAAGQAEQTGAFAGTLGRIGDIDANQASQAGAFAGTVRNPTGITASQAEQTGAFSGELGRIGDIAASQAPDGAAFAGGVVVAGDLAAGQAEQTGAFSGVLPLAGELDAVQAPQVGRFFQTTPPTSSGVSFEGELAGVTKAGRLAGVSRRGTLRGISKTGRLRL